MEIFKCSPAWMQAEKRSALYWKNPNTSFAFITRRHIHHCAPDSHHFRHIDLIKEDFVQKYYSTVAKNFENKQSVHIDKPISTTKI